MGLLGLLAAVLIVLLLLIFSNSSLSPFNVSPEDAQNIRTKAQDAVNSEAENARLEQNQIRNIDLP